MITPSIFVPPRSIPQSGLLITKTFAEYSPINSCIAKSVR
jgi:hypothetical protein